MLLFKLIQQSKSEEKRARKEKGRRKSSSTYVSLLHITIIINYYILQLNVLMCQLNLYYRRIFISNLPAMLYVREELIGQKRCILTHVNLC